MAAEQGGNALDDAWGIDRLRLELGSEVERGHRRQKLDAAGESATRSAHILHDIQEAVIDVWLLCELDLDLVQVGQSVLDVERPLLCLRLRDRVSADVSRSRVRFLMMSSKAGCCAVNAALRQLP